MGVWESSCTPDTEQSSENAPSAVTARGVHNILGTKDIRLQIRLRSLVAVWDSDQCREMEDGVDPLCCIEDLSAVTDISCDHLDIGKMIREKAGRCVGLVVRENSYVRALHE